MNEATSKPTVNDTMESLNGYEEQKIEKLFGGPVGDLLEERPSTGLRALIFAIEARENAKTAYDKAMSLSLKEVPDYFADEEDEVLPEEPVTEQGKDDSLSD